MTEPLLFCPAEGADYLAVSSGEIIWSKDAEAVPEEAGDPCEAQ